MPITSGGAALRHAAEGDDESLLKEAINTIDEFQRHDREINRNAYDTLRFALELQRAAYITAKSQLEELETGRTTLEVGRPSASMTKSKLLHGLSKAVLAGSDMPWDEEQARLNVKNMAMSPNKDLESVLKEQEKHNSRLKKSLSERVQEMSFEDHMERADNLRTELKKHLGKLGDAREAMELGIAEYRLGKADDEAADEDSSMRKRRRAADDDPTLNF